MGEAGHRALRDQRKWLNLDLHMIRQARPRYQTKDGPLHGGRFCLEMEKV